MLTRNVECTGRNTMRVSVCWQWMWNVRIGTQWYILTLSLYSFLYIQHSLSAYWDYHCIPTCTFNIPCQHTDTLIVFLPVHSTFLVSILTLSLYFYLYIQHSLSAYWHSHCIPTRNVECTGRNTMRVSVCWQGMLNVQVGIQWECQYADKECWMYR
jgi:hypothetical protein